MAKPVVRIGVIGAKGRLGSAILKVLESECDGRCSLGAALDRDNATDIAKHIDKVDVFLDVSTPTASEKLLVDLLGRNQNIPFVVGCTGWTDMQLKAVHNYAERAPVVFAPNFSPGVNLFLNLIELAAPLLKNWGYNVSVHEIHHTKKVDAPSGTAKAIVERLGNMTAQVHSTRAGNVVGTHEVSFFGPFDKLTLTHEALDRSIFARGAVMAAEWAGRQASPGLYSMRDVIFGDKS